MWCQIEGCSAVVVPKTQVCEDHFGGLAGPAEIDRICREAVDALNGGDDVLAAIKSDLRR